MNDEDFLAEQFEANRPQLRAVAYRMLGSLSEADDAVQEAWIRLSRSDSGAVENLGGWLTTVVGRVCLDLLRSRKSRREHPLEVFVPDPVVSFADSTDPEQEAVLVDSVGLALLVVLETLTPAERLAFVLHDLFAMPFDEIAPIVGRSSVAVRQLASRARRRVHGSAPLPTADLARQREVVDAFLGAARRGDFEALVAVLDPEVVLRADAGVAAGAGAAGDSAAGDSAVRAAGSRLLRGAAAVASSAIYFSRFTQTSQPALVNGGAGVVSVTDGQVTAVLGFTIVGPKIVEIDILADPERLGRLNLPV